MDSSALREYSLHVAPIEGRLLLLLLRVGFGLVLTGFPGGLLLLDPVCAATQLAGLTQNLLTQRILRGVVNKSFV